MREGGIEAILFDRRRLLMREDGISPNDGVCASRQRRTNLEAGRLDPLPHVVRGEGVVVCWGGTRA